MNSNYCQQAVSRLIMLAACSLMVACGSDGGSSDSRADIESRLPATTDRFESANCSNLTNPTVVQAGFLGNGPVACGYVLVPEDWTNPDGPEIRVAVYRIPSRSDSPAADPVVYLEGGPGGSGVASVADFVSGSASYLRDRSDVIVIDQRGTGYSIPSLFCSEVLATEAIGGNAENAHRACSTRYASNGVDLANYHSANIARDIEAVREALGYRQWNLYGVSYGSRLALTVMRDQPQGVRSVVLDSVFPIEVNGIAESPFTYLATIDLLAAQCNADAECAADIGDIKPLIEDGIARLAAAPIDDFTAAVYVQLLADQVGLPTLPSLITAVANGNAMDVTDQLQAIDDADQGSGLPASASQTVELFPFTTVATAMAYAVICSEEAPFPNTTSGLEITTEFRQSTRLAIDSVSPPFDPNLCSVYDVDVADIRETMPVMSEIPALVLAGSADTTTPVQWSQRVADTLSQSQYVEVPGESHGVLGSSDCVNTVTRAFLDSPAGTVDQTCTAALPRIDYLTAGR